MAFGSINILKTDFIGSIKIADNGTSSLLTEYINEFTEIWLKRIVGASSSDFIEANNPPGQRYIDLINGVTYYNTRLDKSVYIDGMLYALKRLIYFEYVRDYYKDSTTGKIHASNENSTNASKLASGSYATAKFNEASDVIDNIWLFIEQYTGSEISIDSITDLGGGILRINVSDTEYLLDGMSVKMNGVDYTVSSLVADTSFEVTSTNTTASSFTYDAFSEIYTTGGKSSYCKIGRIIS